MRYSALLLALLLLALGAPARGQDPGWSEAEHWAWTKIQAGETAGFNGYCRKTLDLRDPASWNDKCRQVSPRFLVDVLTVPKWRDQVGHHGVLVSDAHLDGKIDLRDAEIVPELQIAASRIEGDLDFDEGHLKHGLSLEDSVLTGRLLLHGAAIDGDLALTRAVFTDVAERPSTVSLDLHNANVSGNLDLTEANVTGAVDLGSLTVGGNLNMVAATFAGMVDPRNGKVRANLDMPAAASAGAVDLRNGKISGDLNMTVAVFKDNVDLRNATVGTDLTMDTVSFAAAMNGEGLTIRGNLFMRNYALFAGEVGLTNSQVHGNIEMSAAFFGQAVNAEGLEVTGNLFMRDHTVFAGEVGMIGAKVRFLDLRSAIATRINLSEAAGDALLLGGLAWLQTCVTDSEARLSPDPAEIALRLSNAETMHWPLGSADSSSLCAKAGAGESELILRNAHFQSFQDDDEAWPLSLDLEGFRYDRLGGELGGNFGAVPVSTRSSELWANWLARQRTFSRQPYAQLAAVLTASGNREAADEILLASRKRELKELSGGLYWLWLKLLSAVDYGIGVYAFWAIAWGLMLAVAGLLVLHHSPYARQRGPWWMIGASLHRLVPGVEFGKEYRDFFDNTKPEPGEPPKLSRWQVGYFVIVALAGWVLSFFLLAAMNGLIPK